MSVSTGQLRGAVAEEVRVLLARRRLSAAKVAEQLGWSQSYMAKRMSGAQPFDVDDLEALAETFGVPVVDLLPRVTRGYLDHDPSGNTRDSALIAAAPIGEPPRPAVRRPPARTDTSRPGGGPPRTQGRTAPTYKW